MKGAAVEKQVCAMNYTSGEMSYTSDECMSECFLFSHICSHSLWEGSKSINQYYIYWLIFLKDTFNYVEDFGYLMENI